MTDLCVCERVVCVKELSDEKAVAVLWLRRVGKYVR